MTYSKLLLQAADNLKSCLWIVSPDTANEDVRIVNAFELMDRASATLFVFRVGRYVGKKTGSSKIRVIAAHVKAFQTEGSQPRADLLPRCLADWAGIVEVAQPSGELLAIQT